MVERRPVVVIRAGDGTPLPAAGLPPRAPRRRWPWVALLLAAGLAVGAVVLDDALRRRESAALLDRAAAARSAVDYADAYIAATRGYTSPAVTSASVSDEVRASLRGIVQDSAAARLGGLRDQLGQAKDLRVLPWHGPQRAARERLVDYLAVRVGYVASVAEDFGELYRPHPELAAALADARAAFVELAPEQAGRVQEVFGPLR